ncbi:MAG TPA: hypothetical protein VGO62_08005 [Myxococcota bacterium]|jgi:hypothetical protein
MWRRTDEQLMRVSEMLDAYARVRLRMWKASLGVVLVVAAVAITFLPLSLLALATHFTTDPVATIILVAILGACCTPGAYASLRLVDRVDDALAARVARIGRIHIVCGPTSSAALRA